MATTKISSAATRDAIKAFAETRYAPETFTVEGWPPVDLRMLKQAEYDALYHVQTATTTGSLSNWEYNSRVCAAGVVAPVFTYEEWMEFPEEFVSPIAIRIVEKGREWSEKQRQKGGERLPFLNLNGLASGSPTDSDGKPAKPSTTSTTTPPSTSDT